MAGVSLVVCASRLPDDAELKESYLGLCLFLLPGAWGD